LSPTPFDVSLVTFHLVKKLMRNFASWVTIAINVIGGFDCTNGNYGDKLLNPVLQRFGILPLLASILLFANPLPIRADDGTMTITPYIGYRDGGEFNDETTDTRLDIDESESFGLIVGWDVNGGQLEVSYSRQASELTTSKSVSDDVLVDVDVHNLMFAGKSILDPDFGTYISFLLGLTHYEFEPSDVDSATRPALGFGSGIDRRINDSLGYRVGLRGIVTIFEDDDEDFCDSSSDCSIRLDSNSILQWEIFTGLSFRF